jgi:hypothetical protein
MLLVTVVIIIVIAFAIIAMNTGDILWFIPIFNGKPQSIVVHCYGEDVHVEPWNSAYEPLNLAVNESLSGSKRWDPLSMSDQTYSDYQTSTTMMVLELTYDPPERIHSSYKFFKNLDKLVIPLDGRHASSNSVFGRLHGLMLAGSMHVKTTEKIVTALEQQELCRKP